MFRLWLEQHEDLIAGWITPHLQIIPVPKGKIHATALPLVFHRDTDQEEQVMMKALDKGWVAFRKIADGKWLYMTDVKNNYKNQLSALASKLGPEHDNDVMSGHTFKMVGDAPRFVAWGSRVRMGDLNGI